MIYVSYDGDSIGAKIGAARLSNDIVQVRKVNELINAGNRVFQSFVDSCLGAEMIESAGDEGCFTLPPDKMVELPAIAKKYYDLTGCTVTIGVGMDLAQSSKALLIGKVHGKANLTIYAPEMEDEIQKIAEHPISETQKQYEAYLGSEDSDYLHKAADPAEIQKRLQPNVSTAKAQPSLPPVKAPEGEEAPQEEAPVDHEQEFHNFAQAQGAQDLNDRTHSKESLEQIKKELTEVLQTVRQQLPNIAQLKQVAPEAYQSIVDLVQGVVALGTEVMSKHPDLNKSEDLFKGISDIAPGKITGQKLDLHPSTSQAKVYSRKFDYSHVLHPDMQSSGFKLHVEHKNTMLPKGVKEIVTDRTAPHLFPVRPSETIHSVLTAPNGNEIGHVRGHVYQKGQGKAIEPHSDLDPAYHGKGLGSSMYEAAFAHAKSTGVNRVAGGVHSPDAHALHTRLSKKHGFHYKGQMGDEGFHADDNPFPYKSYSYALKTEKEPHENENGFIGPGHGPIFYRDDEITKDEEDPSGSGSANEGQGRRMGANAGGAQSGRAHVKLPVGSTYQGKTKIINGETGLANWRSVKGGAIASQLHNPPILGANSSATSANNPDR